MAKSKIKRPKIVIQQSIHGWWTATICAPGFDFCVCKPGESHTTWSRKSSALAAARKAMTTLGVTAEWPVEYV